MNFCSVFSSNWSSTGVPPGLPWPGFIETPPRPSFCNTKMNMNMRITPMTTLWERHRIGILVGIEAQRAGRQLPKAPLYRRPRRVGLAVEPILWQ